LPSSALKEPRVVLFVHFQLESRMAIKVASGFSPFELGRAICWNQVL